MSRGRAEADADERTWVMEEVIVELDERVTIFRGLSLGNCSKKGAKEVPILLPDCCLAFANCLMAAQTCSTTSFERELLLLVSLRGRCFSIMSRLDKTTLRMGAPMLSRPFFQRCHAANLALFHHAVWSLISIRGITSR